MSMTERAISYRSQAVDYQTAAPSAAPSAAPLQERHLRVLDGSEAVKRANNRRLAVVKFAVALLVVVAYLLSVAFIEAKISIAGHQISSIKSEISNLSDQGDRLDLAIGTMASGSRVEEYAMANLGMVYPAVDDVHYLSQSSSQIIATGLQSVNEPPAEQQVEEKPLFWASIGQMFQDFFQRPALAAEK